MFEYTGFLFVRLGVVSILEEFESVLVASACFSSGLTTGMVFILFFYIKIILQELDLALSELMVNQKF